MHWAPRVQKITNPARHDFDEHPLQVPGRSPAKRAPPLPEVFPAGFQRISRHQSLPERAETAGPERVPADGMKEFPVVDPFFPKPSGRGRPVMRRARQRPEAIRKDGGQPGGRRIAQGVVEVPRRPPSCDLTLPQSPFTTPTFEEPGDAGHMRPPLLARDRPRREAARCGRSDQGVRLSQVSAPMRDEDTPTAARLP